MVKFSSGEASEEFTSPKRVKLSDCEGSSQVPNMGNNLNCSGAAAAAAAAVGSGKALIAAIDPDAFECSICMEPLSSPIFQCSNGHIACSSCCVMMDNRCPSCLKPTGKIRCLAIEKLIESMKVGCRYAHNGCRELVRYSQMTAHESKCIYAPYLCSVSGCSFSGPSTQFSHHFTSVHGARVIHFRYEAWFTVLLATDEQFCILEGEDMIFLLQNKMKPLGNIVYATCIGPASSEDHYSYQIEIKKGRRRLTMESVPRSIVGIHEIRQDFLLIPVETYEEDGHLTLELSFRHVI
jgi:E3 ubiquitin-protein ligase SIAH1